MATPVTLTIMMARIATSESAYHEWDGLAPNEGGWILAAANSGAQAPIVTVRAVENATIGGVPAFTDINTLRSLAQQDIAGTTVTGGIERWSSVLAATSDLHVPIELLKMLLFPGDTITFAASGFSGNNDIWIRVGWRELN